MLTLYFTVGAGPDGSNCRYQPLPRADMGVLWKLEAPTPAAPVGGSSGAAANWSSRQRGECGSAARPDNRTGGELPAPRVNTSATFRSMLTTWRVTAPVGGKRPADRPPATFEGSKKAGGSCIFVFAILSILTT